MSGDHWKIVVKTQWTDVERHFQVRCGYCHGFHPNEKLVQISECLMLQGAGVNNAGHGRMLVRQLDDTRVMPGWVYEPFLLLPAQLAVALLSRTIHHSQKIFRVRMIQEGHVRVVWINSNDKLATPRYSVTFACYEPSEEFDAQKSKAIIGEAELFRFLYVINIDANDLKTGSHVLHERDYVEFANVVLSDERLVNYDLR